MVQRMIRAAGRRAADGDPEQLKALFDLQGKLEAAIVESIRGMRASGATWESIGAISGVTRQAALMRWSPKLGEQPVASESGSVTSLEEADG